MSTPSEGLNALLYVGTACPAGTGDIVALLQAISLTGSQDKVRFYHMGSLNHYYVLDGVIAWDLTFRWAYLDNRYLGTLMNGTTIFCGSLIPRGVSSPAILGSLKLTSVSLANMEAENANAVMEEDSAIFYNLSTVG